MVILKLDFEKAFDEVNLAFILSILQAKGFGPKWCQWILQILSTTSSSLLLKGLGLPLSTTKPRKEFFMPLILSAQRRLNSSEHFLSNLLSARKFSFYLSCCMFLNYGDKPRLVNSVLSSLPTFYLCTLKVYKSVLGEFDKYRRHCVWRHRDLEHKSTPLAGWDLVCRPKDQGGLGIINLEP
jgi:hypothetical protein